MKIGAEKFEYSRSYVLGVLCLRVQGKVRYRDV